MKTLPELDLDAVVTVRENPISCNLDNETVLLSIEKGKYYGMGEVGTRIWDLLAEKRTISDICETLVAEYRVSREQCREDVKSFIHELYREGLVQHVRTPA